jgi:RNA polymerase sigma-70 factor (ECF subfamily)
MVWGVLENEPLDEWIVEAQQGDTAAFELLMRQYEHQVFRTCVRLLGNREDAKDAAQDTFIRMHKYLPKFNRQKPLLPWLYRIAVNACRDHSRKQKKHVATPLNPEVLAIADKKASSDVLERERDLQIMEAALRTLSPREREVLVLKEVEELSTKEVAQVTGSREVTVRSQLSRAHEKMRRYRKSALEYEHEK